MRKSWHATFFNIAQEMSERSTCLHRQYGCVAVRDKMILATGYNGAPRGLAHCTELGCARDGMKSGEHPELCRATHAEQNVVASAARLGISLIGSTLYIKDLPCILCTKIIINAGIREVIVLGLDYPGHDVSLATLRGAGVRVYLYIRATEEIRELTI